jgi:drug/metabolite transporter (DMT)-like permease
MSGPIEMFIAAVLFSFMSVLVKISSNTIPAAEITSFRSIISIMILVAMMYFNKASRRVSRMDKLVFRGVIGGLSFVLYFYALTLTSVANAVVLDFTYPIFAAIFAVIYLNERMRKRDIGFMFMAFLGLLIIFQFNFSSINIGDALALSAAVASGIAIVAIRDLRKTDNSIMITLAFSIGGLFFSALLLRGNIVMPTLNELMVLVSLSVFGTFGQLFMARALKTTPTALGSVISMSTIIITALLSVLVFDEPLTYPLMIGGLLIFSSAAFFSREETAKPAK